MKLGFRVPLALVERCFSDSPRGDEALEFILVVMKNCHTLVWTASREDLLRSWDRYGVQPGSALGHLVSVIKDSVYQRKSLFEEAIPFALPLQPIEVSLGEALGQLASDVLLLSDALTRARAES